MPSGDIPWNRKSVCLVFIPQGLLSFFIFLVASVDVGLSRRWIATYNDYYDEPEEGEYRSHWDSSPAQYPYAYVSLSHIHCSHAPTHCPSFLHCQTIQLDQD